MFQYLQLFKNFLNYKIYFLDLSKNKINFILFSENKIQNLEPFSVFKHF